MADSSLNKIITFELLNRKIQLKTTSENRLQPLSQLIYMMSMIIGFGLLCEIAQFFFPEPFSILIYTISEQGNPITNPKGYIIFNLGLILFGSIQIPHFIYFWKNFRKFMPHVSLIGFILHLIGSISIIFVGIFPMHIQPHHRIAALTTFCAYLLATNIDFFILIYNQLKINPIFLKPRMICFFAAIFNLIFAFMLSTEIIEIPMNQVAPQLQPIFKFPLWEWAYLIVNIFWMLIVSFFLYNYRTGKNLWKEAKHHLKHLCSKSFFLNIQKSFNSEYLKKKYHKR